MIFLAHKFNILIQIRYTGSSFSTILLQKCLLFFYHSITTKTGNCKFYPKNILNILNQFQ